MLCSLTASLRTQYGLRPGLTGSQATGTDVNNSLLQMNLPQTAATIRAAVADGRSALAQLNSQGLQVCSHGRVTCLGTIHVAVADGRSALAQLKSDEQVCAGTKLALEGMLPKQ